jgi:UPF0755 protein
MKKVQKNNPKQKPGKKKRRGLKIFLAVVLLLLIAAAVTVFILFQRYEKALQPVSENEPAQEFTIEEGDDYSTVLQNLQDAGFINSADAAKLYIKLNGDSGHYAGTFALSSSMSTPAILEYIANPANLVQTYNTVTIPEGSWAKQVAQIIADAFPNYKAEDFINLWNDQSYIETLAQTYSFLDPAVLNNENYFVKLEGYLFPETYYMDKTMTEDEITRMILDQFASVIAPYQAQIDASGYTMQEIITLASIVQFESGSESEMPDIAEVFYNRLEQGMKLQSSVTVCYALYDSFSSAQDCETNTEIDSPYNTYEYDGLPIGPILNPGEAAIKAVLNPAENDYLYFVADIYGDGSVHFATTLEEHEANVDKYNLRITSDDSTESTEENAG